MRLIDADLLKKNIAKWLQGSDPQETEMVKLDDIAVSVIMEIEEQPTAYDVEKVVAKLEYEKSLQEYMTHNACRRFHMAQANIHRCVEQYYQRGIDIVKNGGI